MWPIQLAFRFLISCRIFLQIEVTRRRGRRRKKLLDDLKDRRGYCQLKEEALDRTVWRNCFGRGFGPVVWQITDDDDLINDTIFGKKLLNTKYAFWFPLQLLPEKFLILGRTQIWSKMYIGLHVKYRLCLTDFNEICTFWAVFRK